MSQTAFVSKPPSADTCLTSVSPLLQNFVLYFLSLLLFVHLYPLVIFFLEVYHVYKEVKGQTHLLTKYKISYWVTFSLEKTSEYIQDGRNKNTEKLAGVLTSAGFNNKSNSPCKLSSISYNSLCWSVTICFPTESNVNDTLDLIIDPFVLCVRSQSIRCFTRKNCLSLADANIGQIYRTHRLDPKLHSACTAC